MTHIATLKTKVPNLPEFTMRGVVPLPQGYTYNFSDPCPFTVVDSNGQELITQWDQVSRYANGDVATAKISAIVPRGDLQPGSVANFNVLKKESPTSPPQIHPDVEALLLTEGAMHLRVADIHHNVYEEELSRGPEPSPKGRYVRTHELGPVTATEELAGFLRAPDDGVLALPHFGGLIWWVKTTSDNSRVVELTLDWHNGVANMPLADVYFRTVDLVLPAGWNALSEWPEPLMADAISEDGRTTVPVVTHDPTGKLHMIEQRAERVWRLYLYPDGEEEAAKEVASQRGFAVCVDGENEGKRLWSWRNPATANYYPQRGIMPDLSYMHTAGVLQSYKQRQYTELEQGLPWMGWPAVPGQMGIWNPAGVGYGGMTGGGEIHHWDGELLLDSGEPDGLLYHRAIHRRYSDRAYAALYEVHGIPVVQDNYLKDDGSAPWRIFDNKFQQKSGSTDMDPLQDQPWELDQADLSQVMAVHQVGLQPDYIADLKNYDPIDLQHQTRRTKDLKVLVWLDNDPVAKKHLAMQAELNRMTYAEYHKGRYKHLFDSTFAYPENGGNIGRGDAWPADCNVSHYAVSDDAERQRWFKWMDTMFGILWKMQMPNGGWQRAYSGKLVTGPPLIGTHSAGFAAEFIFTAHALRGLWYSVYEGDNDLKSNICKEIMLKAGVGLWNFYWAWHQDGSGPLSNGPWAYMIVGPLDSTLPPYSTHADHPQEQWVPGNFIDSFSVGSLLAYGWDTVFGTDLDKQVLLILQVYTGSKEPLQKIMSEGLKNIESRAHLIALLQAYDD